MKVALYARVSTKDKGQSTENQLPELRRYTEAHGYLRWSSRNGQREVLPSPAHARQKTS
jgi:DNA invertase Pin-like site-specific DNA recombinase